MAEEAARRLAREIEECGKGCIGKPATKEQLSRLRTAMLSDLQRVASEVQMQRFESVWERMNLKEKVIWFVTRRILPSIGAYIDQVRPPAGSDGHQAPLWVFKDPETVFIVEARMTLDGTMTGVNAIDMNLFVSQ